MSDPIKTMAAAYHEAGHAVVVVWLRLPVKSCRIWVDARDVWTGETKLATQPSNTPEDALKRIAVAFGGIQAVNASEFGSGGELQEGLKDHARRQHLLESLRLGGKETVGLQERAREICHNILRCRAG